MRMLQSDPSQSYLNRQTSSCLTTCKPPTSHCRTIQNTEVRFVGHDLGHIVNLVSSSSLVQRCTKRKVQRLSLDQYAVWLVLYEHLHVPSWMPQRPHIVLTCQPPCSFHLLLVTSTTPNNGIEDSIEDSS